MGAGVRGMPFTDLDHEVTTILAFLCCQGLPAPKHPSGLIPLSSVASKEGAGLLGRAGVEAGSLLPSEAWSKGVSGIQAKVVLKTLVLKALL